LLFLRLNIKHIFHDPERFSCIVEFLFCGRRIIEIVFCRTLFIMGEDRAILGVV